MMSSSTDAGTMVYHPRSSFTETSFGLRVPKHLLEKCEKAHRAGEKHVERMRNYRERQDEPRDVGEPPAQPVASWEGSLEDSVNAFFGSGS